MTSAPPPPPAFVLAHLSDPHLGPLPRPRLHHLLSKRAIGYMTWRRSRHLVHRREVLDALVRDAQAQKPDHVAVTGDLVNIALPDEILYAADWLRSIGAPADVTLVPGNHDAYVGSALLRFDRAWGDFMTGDDAQAAVRFPFLRRRGPLALIGLSSAVPTAPLMATGKVGSKQLAALDALLGSLDDACYRVLLIHHPLAGARRHARLTDADRLAAVLQRHGVDLVLHGHDHRHAVTYTRGPRGAIPVVGITSASVAAGHRHEPAAYNLVTVTRGDDGWRTELVTRSITADGGIAESNRQILQA
jgi:3',5'-cyclic AMP phosphodiesterase CpdA